MISLEFIYECIKVSYTNYERISYDDGVITVKFYDNFDMRISFNGYFMIYFNGFFDYGIDAQDIEEYINEIFADRYMFCLKKKIKIITSGKYVEQNRYDHVWTIYQQLK